MAVSGSRSAQARNGFAQGGAAVVCGGLRVNPLKNSSDLGHYFSEEALFHKIKIKSLKNSFGGITWAQGLLIKDFPCIWRPPDA